MGKKIGILLENRFIDREILYYQTRFAEEGLGPVFLTRLWGQEALTFRGMELGQEMTVRSSFDTLSESGLSEYGCILVPAGYVADYLLYSEKPKEKSPAVQFIERVMGRGDILKAFICHSLWLAGPLAGTFAGRHVTCHNNIISHVENAGMVFEDRDLCIDGDLITARTGGDHALLAREVIRRLHADA